MNLPRSIRVAGIPIKIIRADLSDDDCFGYYSHDLKAIVIHKGLTGILAHDTIRHELMECSLCLGGPAWCEGMETEAIVRCCDNIFWPAWDWFLARFGHQWKPLPYETEIHSNAPRKGASDRLP